VFAGRLAPLSWLWPRLGHARATSLQNQPRSATGRADADRNKTLLLKDFNPVSDAPRSGARVDQAKFYVIDVHNHVNDAARIGEHLPPERVLEVMNKTNVKMIVILTGMWGDRLQAVMDEMVKSYPGRFMVFRNWIGAKWTT